jgi:hypothetical protein
MPGRGVLNLNLLLKLIREILFIICKLGEVGNIFELKFKKCLFEVFLKYLLVYPNK